MKKKNTRVLIDGENITAKKAAMIMHIVKEQGVLDMGKVYGIQKDDRTKNWKTKARELGIEDIRLYGGPQKNKVDNKIKRDANVHKSGMKMSAAIYELTKDIPKIMLTATPMQNTLLDLYGLVQFIDSHVFYNKAAIFLFLSLL